MSPSRLGSQPLSLLLLVTLAVTACSKAPPPKPATAEDSLVALLQGDSSSRPREVARPAVPKELVPVALAAAQKSCKSDGGICKDFAIHPNGDHHPALTAADRANGIDDRWCVSVSYLSKGHVKWPWQNSGYATDYVKKGGVWQIETVDARANDMGCMSF